MKLPTNRSPTMVDNVTTTTTITTITRAPRTTATKERHPTMDQKYSASFALDQRKSTKFKSCSRNMLTTLTGTWKQRQAKSTTEFIKNRTGNSAHIDEVELEALAELMDHPIEHVIHEINLFSFSEIEESNESCM